MNKSTYFANSLDTDFKFEVVIASLIEDGCDPELIRILRDGIDRRTVAKEIEKVEEKYNSENFKKYTHVHVNREGMYDILPEGIFHKKIYQQRFRDAESDIEKSVEQIKIHREQEFFARRFFQLFEQFIDQILVEIHQTEIRYNRNTTNKEFVELFFQYWSVLKLLEHRQAVAFMYVIPLLARIRQNQDEVAESISFILDVPVKIEKIKLPAKKADSQFESHLAVVRLGEDLVLGTTFDDGIKDLKITIGPISANRMRGFLETAHEHTVLIMLVDLFIQDELFFIFDYKIDPEDSIFTLSDENFSTYLGINSYI